MTQYTPLINSLLERGRRLWEAEQWAMAEQCWSQVLSFAQAGTAPWREALVRLGRLAERVGDYVKARKYVRQLLRCQAHRARWYYWMGRLYRRDRRTPAMWRRALQYLRRAVGLAPRQARYWSELGRCLADAGHPRPALRCLTRAWQLEPHSIRHLLWLVELLLASDRFAEAQRVVDQARFLYRGNEQWEVVRTRLGFAKAQLYRSRFQEHPPVLLPFPAASPHIGAHTPAAAQSQGLPNTPSEALSQLAEPRIIRIDPGHKLSRHSSPMRWQV